MEARDDGDAHFYEILKLAFGDAGPPSLEIVSYSDDLAYEGRSTIGGSFYRTRGPGKLYSHSTVNDEQKRLVEMYAHCFTSCPVFNILDEVGDSDDEGGSDFDDEAAEMDFYEQAQMDSDEESEEWFDEESGSELEFL